MKLRLIILFFGFLMFTACKKNKQHPVPYIPFDMQINISLPSYSNLMGVGGWAYVYGGSRGIIVYRRAIDEFVAFDRHSPADPDALCDLPLYPDNDNFLTLIDSCNNATFSLYDGSPISNSEWGLRQFQTQFDGNTNLRIYN